MTRLRLDALRASYLSIGGDPMLGFYFHVPFCHGKCPYCDFYSLPDSQEDMDAYVQAVLTSLAPWRSTLAGGPPVFWGPSGWEPSSRG